MDTQPSPVPQVAQRTTKPKGVLPRHTQAWVIGGVAVTMITILALTGNPPPPDAAAKLTGPPPLVMDPSQAHIQDYRAQLEAQTKRLAEEQARLSQAKQALDHTAGVVASDPEERADAAAATSAPRVDRDPLGREQAEREYRSLFTPNLAVSYRAGAATDAVHPPDTTTTPGASARPVTGASAAGSSQASAGPTAPASGPTARVDATAPPAATGDGPRYRVFEGTVIEAVLTNRLTGSFAGPVNCLVTNPVYAADREHLVIPQGSRVLGEVRRVDVAGQDRLAVVFHRVIRPDGSTASLEQEGGLNQIGETGLRDQVDHHYLQVFGMSAAIGAIAGLAQGQTRYSALDTSASDAYRQGASASLAQSSMHTLDHYLNQLPTLTIREGHRIKVYLSRDLWLPPYPTVTVTPR